MYKSYQFIFVEHKTYTQNDVYDASGYSIKINNSYYSDKNYAGEVISDDSAFVILDVNIKNNGDDRDLNLKRFHIMNGVSNVTEESNIYGEDFKDLGRIYNGDIVSTGEDASFIMVFRVPKKLKAKRFVLFYQELDEKSKYSRFK